MNYSSLLPGILLYLCWNMQATSLAWTLAQEKGLYDTTLGLVGAWGPIIHEWLDQLVCSFRTFYITVSIIP